MPKSQAWLQVRVNEPWALGPLVLYYHKSLAGPMSAQNPVLRKSVKPRPHTIPRPERNFHLQAHTHVDISI